MPRRNRRQPNATSASGGTLRLPPPPRVGLGLTAAPAPEEVRMIEPRRERPTDRTSATPAVVERYLADFQPRQLFHVTPADLAAILDAHAVIGARRPSHKPPCLSVVLARDLAHEDLLAIVRAFPRTTVTDGGVFVHHEDVGALLVTAYPSLGHERREELALAVARIASLQLRATRAPRLAA